jgi:hypothetical protein
MQLRGASGVSEEGGAGIAAKRVIAGLDPAIHLSKESCED